MIRLGINIDHVATVRNARGGAHPCPVRAALLAAQAGADGITAHLREDRRHIRDSDIERIKAEVNLPLNLEMAMTQEMLEIALRAKPNAVCIVPEKRQELTTEGGLDVVKLEKDLKPFVHKLRDAGIRVSLFIAPHERHIEAAQLCGADIIELHTGEYAQQWTVDGGQWTNETKPLSSVIRHLSSGAALAHSLGLEVHAGHGLTYDNVGPIAALPHVVELNIGHFLIGEAIFGGLENAIKKMRACMNEATK